jgi:putative ABC transport system ATP-binding protein
LRNKFDLEAANAPERSSPKLSPQSGSSQWAVELKHVSKTYRTGPIEVPALRDISLQIAPGEFVATAGPSGSGKTTLLNVIGGLDRADEGEVSVAGQNLQFLSKAELARLRLNRIGFVFQTYNLLPVLTAFENAEFTLLLQGIPSQTRKDRVLKLFMDIGLAGLEDRRPADLSGGQQQRVAVARAMVTEPALILADEPTANLDSVTAISLLEVMERLNQATGTTFVFSTHDPQVMERAHRMIRLRDGRIVSDDRRDS